MDDSDIKVTACNLAEPISECVKGALCYVVDFNMSMGDESRILLLMRSRSGRWIEKYEPLYRLETFRLKTIPPEHPMFERLKERASHVQAADEANTLAAAARNRRKASQPATF